MSVVTSGNRRTAAAGLLFVLLLTVAGLATPRAVAASPLSAISIAIIYESGYGAGATYVVMGEIAEDVTLPAQVFLPVPEGASIIAAYETFSDPARDDLPIDSQLVEHDGGPALELTLRESRIGMAELSHPGARSAATGLENSFDVGFDLTLPTDAAYVYAAVAIPSSLDALSADPPAQVADGPDGRVYYHIERRDAAAGDRIALSVRLHEDWVAEPAVWVAVLVGAVIAASLAVLVLGRRSSRKKRQESV